MFQGKSSFNTGDHRDDPDFKESMLERQNFYRSQTWKGPGGPVKGADIVEVQWDDDLELNAWIWANQQAEQNRDAEGGKSVTHDGCRETKTYNYVGQNINWAAGGNWSKPINVDQLAVSVWNAENSSISDVKMLTESFPGPFINQNIVIGHYTQLMWAKSYVIGCAYVTANSKNFKTQGWVVCNYAQGGNIDKAATFAPGVLGTQCVKGSEGGSVKSPIGICSVNQLE